jgi:GT2 family glycosyltransferase
MEVDTPVTPTAGQKKTRMSAQSAQPADVSIIFVNWNSVDYARDCVRSIREFTHGLSLELIVVDNASPDGRAPELKAEFPEITLIESKENLGFARANNLGFRHSTGHYLLFLNPDTKLVTPAINLLVESAKTLPQAGLLGCRLLNGDLSFQTTSVQKFPTILSQMFDYRPAEEEAPAWVEAKSLAVEMVSGACMLMPREVFIRVGMFSEDYFMYAEDVDLCHAVRRLGLKVYYCGEPTIVHFGGGSSSQTGVEQFVVVTQKTAIMQFCRKTHGPLYAWLYRILMGSAAVGRMALIGALLPFSRRPNLRWSMRKWIAVFKWAIGLPVVRARK